MNVLWRQKAIVTRFEPHFRASTIRRLQSLCIELRRAIGHPEAAAVKSELRSTLADSYRRSIQDPGTRNLATAISLLQDFLRPHWSEISPRKLEAVSEKLGPLATEKELSARVLEKLYRDLASALEARLYITVQDDNETASNAK